MSVTLSKSFQRFFGGGHRYTGAPALLLHKLSKRVLVLDATIVTSVNLPDARTLRTGGPWFYIINDDAFSANVNDFDNTLVYAIPTGEAVVLFLLDNSTAAGVWRYQALTNVSTLANPSLPTNPYCLGGFEDASNAWAYDPVTNTWTEQQDGTNAHEEACGFTISGLAFVCGTNSNAAVDEFDPASGGTWTARAALPVGAAQYAQTGIQIAAFGYSMGGIPTFESANHEYDPPPTNTWTSKQVLPRDTVYGTGASVGGAGYVYGGSTSTNFADGQRRLDRYDREPTDAFTRLKDSPFPKRCEHSFAAVQGMFYCAHGNREDGTSAFNIKNLQVYDPATDVWTRKQDHPVAKFAAGFTRSDQNTRLYSVAGRTTLTAQETNAVHEYHTDADVWTAEPNFPHNTADWDNQCFEL